VGKQRKPQRPRKGAPVIHHVGSGGKTIRTGNVIRRYPNKGQG
jgi:hypothetical protein